ncbi:MAG: transcription termination/antitermination factor NusG [Elusimicrobia bacterium CG08_land_8_20_14_0_20_44_26]|nr:MAG: transcription termination/antitermination factor NusG [Elusimicrobia bacterium CG08_land_8_20_14_0_20_44_26]
MAKEYKFYVVQTLVGNEKKVVQIIENKIEQDKAEGVEPKIKQVIMPEEKVVDIKKKENIVRPRKILPGYLILEMIMDEETFWFVNGIHGVSGFLGGKTPFTVKPQEVEYLQELVRESAKEKPRPSVQFAKHDNVRIKEGPFSNFSGEVDLVDETKGKLRVMVSIFGRSTPVDLRFYQVEKE